MNVTVATSGSAVSLACCRSAVAGPADDSPDHRPAGDHREGSVWGGVAGKVARRGRGGEDLLLQRREVVVSRSRDLSDDHAQTREHLGLHCRGQQRYESRDAHTD